MDQQSFLGLYWEVSGADNVCRTRSAARRPVAWRHGSQSTVGVCKDGMVATSNGEVPAGDLKPGDLVLTLDQGFLPVRFATTETSAGEQASQQDVGVLLDCYKDSGGASPVLVGARQGILLRSPMADLLFSQTEVLVPAAALADAGRATWLTGPKSSACVSIGLPEHALLWVQGRWMESAAPTRPANAGCATQVAKLIRRRLTRREARLVI